MPWFPLELVEHSWVSLLHWDSRSRHPTWSLRENHSGQEEQSSSFPWPSSAPCSAPRSPLPAAFSCLHLQGPQADVGGNGFSPGWSGTKHSWDRRQWPLPGASPPGWLCACLRDSAALWPQVSMSLPSQPAVYPWSQFAFLAPDPSVGPNFKCYQALLSSSPLCPDRLNRPSAPHKHRRRGQFMWSIEWLRRKEVAFISFLKKASNLFNCIGQPFDLIDSWVLTVNLIELRKQMGKSKEFKASHPSFPLIWEWEKSLPKKWRFQARAVNRPSLFRETVVFEDTQLHLLWGFKNIL